MELGKHDVIHTHFLLTLGGDIVNFDENDYASRMAQKWNLKLNVIEHKLENLLHSPEVLSLAKDYGLPHFEWAWQAYMIANNPYARSHFNIGCAGDLHANSEYWIFNPFWTFQERVRLNTKSTGCFLFPLSSNELICSWLFDEFRRNLSRSNESSVEVRDQTIYRHFNLIEKRQKKYVHQQHAEAHKLIANYNLKHFSPNLIEFDFRIPLVEIEQKMLAHQTFEFRHTTAFNSEL